jgi:hypothetical protein
LFLGLSTKTEISLWKANTHVSLGPVFGLDYTVLARPGITEEGRHGTSLYLNPTQKHALRSSVGVRGVVSVNAVLKMDLEARWDRALLGRMLTQKANFVHYSDSTFSTKSIIAEKDSLNLSAEMTHAASQRVTLGVRGSMQLFRGTATAVTGNVLLRVKF